MSAPVAVCMLTQDYFPFVAGAERQLQALVPALSRRGIRVVVLTRRVGGLPARETVVEAPVYRLPARGGRVMASLSFTLGCVLFLARHRRRIDVLHAHNLFSPSTAGVLAKLVLRRRVVVKPLGGGPRGDVGVLRGARLGPLRLRLLARLVDAFVAVSEELACELLAVGVPRERIARIPNGVDTDRFRPTDGARRGVLRQELGLDGRRVALFVGRLAPEKGLDCLLEAWGEVRRALPDALLVLAGDGRLRGSLEARAGPDVRFVGLISDPLAYFQAADCFVLPSLSEGLSNALLEAMASGLPAVATAVGGSVDALRDGVEGWLVAPGDAAGLASALVRALAGHEGERIGAAARARVVSEFSLEGTADRLADLYRQLACKKSPA